MKQIIIFLLMLGVLGIFVPVAQAQNRNLLPLPSPASILATESASIATLSSSEQPRPEKFNPGDFTVPQLIDREEFMALFSQRQITSPTPYNILGYFIQYAVKVGVPANTVILILLLPFLATLIVFSRQIIGLPSLEMLVPVAFSITLVSTGLAAGTILLVTILLASIIARMMLKKIRIMQLPKIALSIFVVAAFVLIALTVSASMGVLAVRQISFFPILVLILLTEKIVSLQLTRNSRQAFLITSVTILLGIFGYSILSSELVRRYLLLYPEVILVLIPINLIMGRYFGLRLTEFYRFSALRKYVD